MLPSALSRSDSFARCTLGVLDADLPASARRSAQSVCPLPSPASVTPPAGTFSRPGFRSAGCTPVSFRRAIRSPVAAARVPVVTPDSGAQLSPDSCCARCSCATADHSSWSVPVLCSPATCGFAPTRLAPESPSDGLAPRRCDASPWPTSSTTQYQLWRSPRSNPMIICREIFLLCLVFTMLTFIAGLLLSLVPMSTSITWERTSHPVRRPAFSSHLVTTLTWRRVVRDSAHCLLREVHSAQEFIEAGVGSQRVKSPIAYFKVRKLGITLLIGFLQPGKSFVPLTQRAVENCDRTRWGSTKLN